MLWSLRIVKSENGGCLRDLKKMLKIALITQVSRDIFGGKICKPK